MLQPLIRPLNHMLENKTKSDRDHRLSALFSSRNDEWETPWDLFRELDNEFHFDIDACALPHNAKCRRFYSPEQNGLIQQWNGNVWMNPPYGRQIVSWVKKATESVQSGATVVCLLPARTDTLWWHNYVVRSSEVRFIRGRIRFVGAQAGAPFPSAIVVFRPMDAIHSCPIGRWYTTKSFCPPTFTKH